MNISLMNISQMTISQMTISASVLILCIVVARFAALKILPKKTFVALWCVVLARLFLPISIPVNFGIGNSQEIGNSPHTAYTLIENMVTNIDDATMISLSSKGTEISILMIAYFIGLAVFLTLFLFAYIKSFQKMQQALPIENNAFIANWKETHKLKRQIKIVTSDRIKTPITFGVIHPKIILPKETDYTNLQQLNYALSHELTHIKRFDVLWKFVSMLAVCLHWFNPLVWLMCVLFNRDIEIACDEKVVSDYGENEKEAYALALISLIEQKSSVLPICNAFGKGAVKERIILIMKFKKSSTIGVILAFSLIAGATIVFAKPSEVIDIQKEIESSVVLATSEEKMLWPLPDYTTRITPFGFTYSPEDEGSGHTGIDIMGEDINGKPVVAANDGTVLYVVGNIDESDAGKGYGKHIILDHGDGITTLYAHLSEVSTVVNETVKAGDIIGNVGATGWVTGPHLHFEVREEGAPVDPQLFFEN